MKFNIYSHVMEIMLIGICSQVFSIHLKQTFLFTGLTSFKYDK